ncbi:c-type cytochrome [Zhouia sp. PK063]|uniref:c-type cytochrome n=1 Tax=Zhouia sp. PK063 TaxID=3373602 RepID=UPI003791BA20
MKQVIHRNSISRVLGLSLLLLLIFSSQVYSQGGWQTGDPAAGKTLFNSNCAACHKLDSKMTGPPLRGVADKLEMDWIYKWVHNSQAMVKSGDADAVAIFNEYNGTVMTSFPQLSEKDIDNIISYVMQPKAEPKAAVAGAQGGGQVQGGGNSGLSNQIILGALVLVFGLLVVMLFLVNKTLRKIAEANGVEYATKESEKRLPIWKAFAKNQFLVLVTTIFLILTAAYLVYGYLMQVGVDQGYQPIQPIHFAHRIHAGDNQIECKYCHSAARVSRHAGIPSLNVCMNCHKTISEYTGDEDVANGYTKEYYTGEIQKLYAAVGWDPNTQSYTGKTHPVKWIKIHNLPDFVYFNHSQHVEVAGVQCQQCHGPIQEMEVVKQYAPLTMGWCINCHRKTNVKMEGNEYYKKIHEELSKKYGVDKLTAAQMGGIECGKCHY